jgi:very-short-patch-repair endonuclease
MNSGRFSSRADLLASMSDAQVNTAVRNGRLHRLAHNIYSIAEPTDELRLQALHDIRGWVYTGRTAIDLYQGRPVNWPVEARHAGSGRRTAEAHLRSGIPERLRTGNGLSLVSPLQAVMDAASPEEYAGFLTDAYQRIGAHEALERDLASLVTGRSAARELLAVTPTGTMSKLEQDAFRIISDALTDLPVTVLTNRMVGNYCFDVVIPEAKVAIEIDSFTYHALGGQGTTERSFVKLVWKDNETADLGWLVRHYTQFCIRGAADRVAEDVRNCVLPRMCRVGVSLPDTTDVGQDAVFTWHPVFRPEPWCPPQPGRDPAD